MSDHSSSGKPIPKGILVASRVVKKAERLAPARPRASGGRQLPWAWIAAGGSMAWVVIVLVIALLTLRQERATEEARPGPRPLAVDGGMAEAPGMVQRIENLPEVVFDAEPERQPLPAPKLVRPEMAAKDDLAPPLDILPEDMKPAPPEVAKPARKIVDLRVFQDPQQIGCDVLFVRDTVEAFKRAREEKKMVFMVHLSGNLEDPDFT